MDYSGTIVDDIRPTKDALNYVLIRRGMDPVSITQFRHEFDLPYWRYLVSCGISEDEAKSNEVLREIEDAYMMHLYQVVPFREAVRALWQDQLFSPTEDQAGQNGSGGRGLEL